MEVFPVRLTVKVNGVLEPAAPSALDALVAEIDNAAPVSSLVIVPVAVVVAIVAPVEGLDKVTVKPSVGSTAASPATLTVITLLVSPAAKLTVPAGNAPPMKSAALAGLEPEPVTAHFALAAMEVFPVRLTVKVNGVLEPAAPSALDALVAEIDNAGEVPAENCLGTISN